MKQIYYVIQTLIHSKGGNVIKIISLGLGLAMSILLFSRVAYLKSFDTCFAAYENLHQVWTIFTIKGEEYPKQQSNQGPVPGAIYEFFPETIESATSVGVWQFDAPLYIGENRFETRNICADSLFFRTMGIEVTSGTPVTDLVQQDVVYLSESLACQMFHNENPIGKQISYNKNDIKLTVKGTYKDIPENATLQADAVISLTTARNRHYGYYGWGGGDSWKGYVRVKPGTDLETLNKQIETVIAQRMPENAQFKMDVFVQPIRDTYQENEDIKRMMSIMTILAASILFITALNYVLISVSSLSRRAKAIGVHKCNGAETGTIFGMFLWETAIIIVMALLLMTFLILNFRDFVEDMLSVHLDNLFTTDRIWVALSVIAFLFVVGGVLPGKLFSRLPVSLIFKRYTDSKKGWKRPLLFVQFAGVAFVCGLMCVVMIQYRYVMNKDTGYNPERMVTGYQASNTYDGVMAIKAFYEGLPYVEAVTLAYSASPIEGYSGEFITDASNTPLFSSRYDYWTENYVEVMGMTLKEGRMPKKRGEVIVNETFVDMMHWGNEAIGKRFGNEEATTEVVGVVKNFIIGSCFNEAMPFVGHFHPSFGGMIHLRLKEPFMENLQKLNKEVEEAYPDKTIEFESLEMGIEQSYNSVRIFRNATMVAAVVILFITLMGLIGYTNDETQRRSKEIAIRKVNGAEASGIIRLLTKDVMLTALPAVVLGTLAAWYVGELWMSQFSVTIGSTLPYYILTGLATLVLIVACVTIKTWRIANENPVVSIKSE